MTCIPIAYGVICMSPSFRLPLSDGSRVYMEWHSYCGPTFYRDKYMNRIIEDWWESPAICAALDWFISRGKKA